MYYFFFCLGGWGECEVCQRRGIYEGFRRFMGVFAGFQFGKDEKIDNRYYKIMNLYNDEMLPYSLVWELMHTMKLNLFNSPQKCLIMKLFLLTFCVMCCARNNKG